MPADTIATAATVPLWEQILNNPWIISIASGLLTSVIVYIITKPIITKRKKRELKQKATSANHEVLYSLRAGIPDGNIPEYNIIQRIIGATARKYDIALCDMLSVNELFSDIIKEVFDSAFISSDKKIELCNRFNEIAERSNDRCRHVPPELSKDTSLEVKEISFFVTTVVSSLSALFAYIISKNEIAKIANESSINDYFVRFFTPIAILMVVVTVLLAIKTYLTRQNKRFEKEIMELYEKETKELYEEEINNAMRKK